MSTGVIPREGVSILSGLGWVRKSAVYPGRFGDNLEGRTSVLHFRDGAWEYDKIA